MLQLQPISWDEAVRFIAQHHRHHLPPQGWKYGIAANYHDATLLERGIGPRVVGVVTVGRPVARLLDDGWTLEVTRCCTDGTPHAASMLYAAAWRAARALGYKRLITYTLASEAGTSLRAAGWRTVGSAGGGSWHREARPRVDKAPTMQKVLWDVVEGGVGGTPTTSASDQRERSVAEEAALVVVEELTLFDHEAWSRLVERLEGCGDTAPHRQQAKRSGADEAGI